MAVRKEMEAGELHQQQLGVCVCVCVRCNLFYNEIFSNDHSVKIYM